MGRLRFQHSGVERMLLIHVNDAEAKFNRGLDTFIFRTQIFRPWVATISALPSACSPQKLQDSPACSESPTITHKFLPSSRQQLLFSKSPSMLYGSEVSPLLYNIFYFPLLSS